MNKKGGCGVKKMSSMETAMLYAGAYLGAGFVSGNELRQFFFDFGGRGYLGMLLAVLLLTAIGILVLRTVQLGRLSRMDELIVPRGRSGVRLFVGVCQAVFTISTFIIMCAGAGALLAQVTGLPTWIGSGVFCGVTAMVACAGVQGMTRVFALFVPLLVTAAFLLGCISAVGFDFGAAIAVRAQSDNVLMPHWILSALSYVGFNVGGSLGIFSAVEPMLGHPRTVVAGVGLSALLLLPTAFSVLTVLSGGGPQITNAEFPMLAYAWRLSPAAGVLYLLLLFGAMFGNALAALVATAHYLGETVPDTRRSPRRRILLLSVPCYALSLFGFSRLIGTLYPLFGYLSLFFIAAILRHYLRLRRRVREDSH